MDLPALIRARRARPGNSLREMEERGRKAGYYISRSAISDYEHGRIAARPGAERVEAIAAALGCTYDEVAAAVEESYSLDRRAAPDPQRTRRTEAWLRLTDERTEKEIEELLLIVEQVLRMRDLEGRED